MMLLVTSHLQTCTPSAPLGCFEALAVCLPCQCLVRTARLACLRVQVLRDFRLPEGASEDDVDANGDGEVLAVLDLGTDDSLVEAGLAREVVNRVQKLRKKAGLVASDVVDVYLNAQLHSEGESDNKEPDLLPLPPLSELTIVPSALKAYADIAARTR